MKSRVAIWVGLLALLGCTVAAIHYRTSPRPGVDAEGPPAVSVRDLGTTPPGRADHDAAAARHPAESLRREAARGHYRELLTAIRHAAQARDAREANAPPDVQPTAAPDYAPDEMPRPDSRSSPSDAPVPSREEQHRFFAAFSEQADPLIDDCYRALPEPRPAGELKLVWSTIYDADVGTVVERIELDESSEITDPRMLECARESIFSVQLPDLEGYGRLQVTSHQAFDGHGLVDEDDAPEGI